MVGRSFLRVFALVVFSAVSLVGVTAVVGAGATTRVPTRGRATISLTPRPCTLVPAAPAASPWQALTNAPPFCPGAMLQLTDGSVIVQDQCTGSNWWKLTPDKHGSYVDGTWSQIASLPDGYTPTYFGSACSPTGG